MKVSGERIYQARLAADMSRADLATAIRRVTDDEVLANESGVRKWERELVQPSALALAAVAEATGRALSYFFVGRRDADAPLSREAAIHEALRPLAKVLAGADV